MAFAGFARSGITDSEPEPNRTMRTIIQLFTRRKKPIYTTRIFETRNWRDQAVTEALYKQSLDCELTTNPNIKEQ